MTDDEVILRALRHRYRYLQDEMFLMYDNKIGAVERGSEGKHYNYNVEAKHVSYLIDQWEEKTNGT